MSTLPLASRAMGVAGFVLFWAGTALAADVPPAPPRTPEVWAVIVGIDQYADKAIPPCTGAVRDARAIQQWFQQRAGWSREHLLLFQDAGLAEPAAAPEQLAELRPTRKNLEWAMTKWLADRLKPGDIVLFTFAGRSYALPPPVGSVPGTPAREYLLPVDARTDNPEATSWSLEAALDRLASTGDHPVICWLDTSLQGRGVRGSIVPGADTNASGARWLTRLARWPGVTSWLAADGHPAAEAADLASQSAFTTALLEALGTPQYPQNLLSCLDRMNQDPKLRAQGFRTLGGAAPEVSLWSKSALARAMPERTLLLQRGHADRVESVAFTADSARMVTASSDSTVRIWRTSDRTLLRVLPDYFHLAGVTGLALSSSGQWLASADGAGHVRVWDMVGAAEKRLVGPAPHASRVVSLAFLPDGIHLVSADQQGQAWLWDLSGRELKARPLSTRLTALASAHQPGAIALAVAEDGSKLRLLDSTGAPVEVPFGLVSGDAVTSLALASDGRLLAIGNEAGRVVVYDSTRPQPLYEHSFGQPIDQLELGNGRRLVIRTEEGLHLAALDKPENTQRLDFTGRARLARFAPDGRWLAAVAQQSGHIRLWRITDSGDPQALRLTGGDRATPASVSLGFSPDGQALFSGDQDGGVRVWGLPDGDARPGIAPRRGKVAGLSVSSDRRYLLQLTRDWTAQVWDLQDGRGFTAVDGKWTSGAITPDGKGLVLTSFQSGDVALLDRESGRKRVAAFPRPPAQGGKGPVTWRFGANNVVDGDQMLTVSRDGRFAAAGSSEGPLVCVWSLPEGRLLHALTDPDHQQPITAVDLSADGRRLLSADSGGIARLWELGGEERRPLMVAAFATPDDAITAARILPGTPGRVALGTRSGSVLLWDAGKEQPGPRVARLTAPIRALAFSPDGRWLAVAGADRSVRFVPLERVRDVVRPDLKHPHAEQVNTLLAWPDGQMFVSGSDDTTVRFWHLAGRALLGTLTSVQTPGAAAALGGEEGGSSLDSSWVAYTPDDGLFDGSPGGERQVTWVQGGEVRPLEQFFDSCHVFGLCDCLRQGKRPPAPVVPRPEPPNLAIDRPPQDTLHAPNRTVELTISAAQTGLANVRLYQNGIAVQADSDLVAQGDPRHMRAQVTLRKGVNRFYVMASRPGTIDGRSNEVQIDYDGPDNPGRLHVLAIGISQYQRRALQFAHQDARDLASFLDRNSVYDKGPDSAPIVLTDDQVTTDRVLDGLRTIQKRVRGRPQDTVVVFMAGHTDVRNDRFCLLLPKFPFAEGPMLVAQRGPGHTSFGNNGKSDDPSTMLPYAQVYLLLSHLQAMQRLVILDACQSEAVLDDPAVRLIRRHLDDGSQRARTAYLLAARRGEPANEVAAVKHGLLTYVLLRGMGAAGLETVPGLKVFEQQPDADLDHNGVITTQELRQFATRTLPLLASEFPDVLPRTGAEPLKPLANLHQSPRMQSTGDRAFPLVALPRAKLKPGASP